MTHYSGRSLAKLSTCDDRLVRLFREVDRLGFAHTIITGHRGQVAQQEAFESGHSKTDWPDSKHNASPSLAIDAKPDAARDWLDVDAFRYFAGAVMMQAAVRGLKVRWGGDWDRDGDMNDQSFNDLAHFELVE